MVLMCTWKESCQLKFFTWVSSLTLMAEWFNLCKYLTYESRLRWEGGLTDSAQTVGTTVFKVTICNCLSAVFKELRLARHPPSCEFAEKKPGKVTFLHSGESNDWSLGTSRLSGDTSRNHRSRVAHMLGMEEQALACTSEGLAGLASGGAAKWAG